MEDTSQSTNVDAGTLRRGWSKWTIGMSTLLLLLAMQPVWAQVTFNIAFDASANVLTLTEKNNVTSHLQEAGRRWVGTLAIGGPRSIDITVYISNIPTASAASAVSSLVAPIGGRDTYEQGVATKLRLGTDPNGADADAVVTFGLAYLRNELWFDPDPQVRTAPVPNDKTDAMSTVLHEFGHVLAYNGFADVNTGQPPATYWSVFDRWMIPGQPTLFLGPHSVAAWGTPPDLTTGNINHWANPAQALDGAPKESCVDDLVRWHDGAPVPRQCQIPASVDAPLSADADSTRSVDTGSGLIFQLMNGVVFYRGTRYDISALDLGVLSDVGFTLDRIFVAGFDLP